MDDPGRPPGIVLSAATSFWIPVPSKKVFDFLKDENHRSEVYEIKVLVSCSF
jgi:homeobox-leucine zipper protein